MLLYPAIALSAVAILLLIIQPAVGIPLLLISRPIIDTTFAQPVLFGFKLTEIAGVLVPLAVIGLILFAREEESLDRMPLRRIWTVYVGYLFVSSLIIVYFQGAMDGADVFFRHINGFIGFYMLQAFFHREDRLRLLLLAVIAAGLFPMGVGVYQLVTGHQWIHAESEGITRYIGLYYDAFTVRAYAFQTIFALVFYAAIYGRESAWTRLWALIYGLLSAAVMIRAYSKAGVVSLSLWVAVWTLFQRKFAAFALIAAVAAGVGVYFAAGVAGNIQQIFHKEIGAMEGNTEVSRTFAGRWIGWEAVLDRWKDYSWPAQFFGSGEVATGMHNDYLQILFHGGILGLILYLVLLTVVGIRILSNLRERIDPTAVGALMLYLMWLVDTIGLVPSAYPGYQWFVWGFIGLSFRMREEEAEAEAMETEKEEEVEIAWQRS